MAEGRPGPALTIGVPVILLAAAGYFGYAKLLQPALKERETAAANEKLSASTSSSKKYSNMVRVAGDPWSGYSTFRGEPRLAAELAKSDIGIEYIDDEKLYDQGERMKALAEGKLDLAVTTVDAFLQHGAKHKVGALYPGVIVWAIDESNGGDAIFLSKQRKSFDDVLPVDKVCYASGTPSEHLWDFASLSFARLARDLPTDNGVVAGDCWKKLEAGQVQVAVLWQPFTAIAEKQGYPKVFATGGQADDVIIDIVVASREYVIQQRPILQKLASAYFMTIDGYDKDKGAHGSFITEDCGADCGGDQALGKAVLEGIDFLTFQENMCLWFGQCGKAGKMSSRIQKTARLLSAKGKIESGAIPKPESIINDSFLISLKDRLDEQTKLAAEVAGQETKVEAAKLEAAEVKYEYRAEKAKDSASEDVGTLKLPSIYFGHGQFSVDQNARSIIKSIAEKLESFPALCIKVYGHTNSTGDRAKNKVLSRSRAEAIVGELRTIDAQAFPLSRFDARGFGSEQPILNGGQEDLEASRRTEFKLFKCN